MGKVIKIRTPITQEIIDANTKAARAVEAANAKTFAPPVGEFGPATPVRDERVVIPKKNRSRRKPTTTTTTHGPETPQSKTRQQVNVPKRATQRARGANVTPEHTSLSPGAVKPKATPNDVKYRRKEYKQTKQEKKKAKQEAMSMALEYFPGSGGTPRSLHPVPESKPVESIRVSTSWREGLPKSDIVPAQELPKTPQDIILEQNSNRQKRQNSGNKGKGEQVVEQASANISENLPPPITSTMEGDIDKTSQQALAAQAKAKENADNLKKMSNNGSLPGDNKNGKGMSDGLKGWASKTWEDIGPWGRGAAYGVGGLAAVGIVGNMVGGRRRRDY